MASQIPENTSQMTLPSTRILASTTPPGCGQSLLNRASGPLARRAAGSAPSQPAFPHTCLSTNDGAIRSSNQSQTTRDQSGGSRAAPFEPPRTGGKSGQGVAGPMRSRSFMIAGVVAVAVIGIGAAAISRNTHSAPPATHVTIDGARAGAVFQGVGAISGGGGNSRLLIEYPPAQRQQILDYLFKPGYGAALQILKLEIGGDAYATDGAEPSMEHTAGAINCHAGYEFWMASQAQKLNPQLQIYAL